MSAQKEELWKVQPLLERLRRIVALVEEERTITAAFEIKKLAIDLDKQGLAKRLKDLLAGEDPVIEKWQRAYGPEGRLRKKL